MVCFNCADRARNACRSIIDEASCEVFQNFEAALAKGPAAVDSKSQVLLGDTDLVTSALVRAALLDPVPDPSQALQ